MRTMAIQAIHIQQWPRKTDYNILCFLGTHFCTNKLICVICTEFVPEFSMLSRSTQKLVWGHLLATWHRWARCWNWLNCHRSAQTNPDLLWVLCPKLLKHESTSESKWKKGHYSVKTVFLSMFIHLVYALQINKGLHGYGSIPIDTIFSGMNIHLPAILGFTRYQGFDPIPIW